MGSNCSKGKSCGSTCISKGKKCIVALGDKVSNSLGKISASLQDNGDGEFRPEKYKGWKVEAEGYYGIVSFSPDGKRALKQLIDRKDGKGGFGPHEVDIGKRMAELGHSPRIFSHSDKHIEMERMPGKPLWEGYQRQEGDEPMNSTQALRAAAAIRDLHRLGYYHGDMHNKQFIVDGNNVKLIDFGLSRPASSDPRRVIQDLNKISPLIEWSNPQMDGDPYVRLVRRYRELYRNPPSKKKKEREEYERIIGEQYLAELGSL